LSGYVHLHRSLLGHHAFRNDAEAMVFAWMIARAAWKPVKVRYKDRSLQLERGQLAVSVRDIATAFDRDKGWVERLMTRLRSATMIETRSETGVNIITVCNYDVYQPNGGGVETPRETDGETEARQGQDTEQRREEVKKEEEEEVTRAHARPDPIRTCFDAWNAMAETAGLPTAEKLTDKRRSHLRARIDDYTERMVLDAIAAVPSKPWLMGQNDRGWRADLDWLLRTDSITRLREGKYDHGQLARPANDGRLCSSPAEALFVARRRLGLD